MDLGITFIYSWGGLECQWKRCAEERKESMWGNSDDISLWLHFQQHSQGKKNFLNHSVNESKKISWLGKIAFIYFNGHYCMKKKKAFLAKSESKGYWRYQVLLIVRGTYIYMVVMESFIVMSVYGLQIVVNVIKSLSDVHPYLSQILVLKWSVSQHRYLCIYRYTSLFNFLFHICCKQMQR